jgi:hypothetical protein
MRLFWGLLVVSLALSLVCAGCGSQPPRQLYETSGAFSYDPPPGWQIIDYPGVKYRLSHGSPENEFAPNINVVDEAFSGTLGAYVDANLESLERQVSNLKVLTREDFKTRDNEVAVKVVIENTQQGRNLRQTFFFLGSGNRKYVVTCTALADGGARLDAVFAKSVATFRIH